MVSKKATKTRAKGWLFHGESEGNVYHLHSFAGADSIALDLKERFILGHRFVFLKEGWWKQQTLRSILSMTSFDSQKPQVMSILQGKPLDVLGHEFFLENTKELLLLWTDKESYREMESIQAHIWCPSKKNQTVVFSIENEKKETHSLELTLDEWGIASLPLSTNGVGTFLLRVEHQTCSFVVTPHLPYRLEAEWIQSRLQFSQKPSTSQLVFVVQLSQLGYPFQGDVGVNWIGEWQGQKISLTGNLFRSDANGRIAGELVVPFENADFYALEIQALQDPLLGTLLLSHQEKADVGLQVSPFPHFETLSWKQEVGWIRSPETNNTTISHPEIAILPLSLLPSSGFGFELLESFQELSVIEWSIFSNQETCYSFSELPTGHRQHWNPEEPCLYFMGGILESNQAWEGWYLAWQPSHKGLSVSCPTQAQPLETIEIRLQSESPQPIYLCVREIGTKDGISPCAKSLLDFVQEQLQGVRFGLQQEDFWAYRKQQKVAVSESTQFPAETWIPSPFLFAEEEQILFASCVKVESNASFSLVLPNQETTYLLEILSFWKGVPQSRTQKIEVEKKQSLAMELPLWGTLHSWEKAQVVVKTDKENCELKIWLNQKEVSLFQEGAIFQGKLPVNQHTFFEFPVQTGSLLLQCLDEKKNVLLEEKTFVLPLGERQWEAFQLKPIERMQDDFSRIDVFSVLHSSLQWIQNQTPSSLSEACFRLSALFFEWKWFPKTRIRQAWEERMKHALLSLPFFLKQQQIPANIRKEEIKKSLFCWMECKTRLQGNDELKQLFELSGVDDWIHKLLPSVSEDFVPLRMQNCQDAFRVLQHDLSETRQEEALWEVEKRIQQRGNKIGIEAENSTEKRIETLHALQVLATSSQEKHQQLWNDWMDSAFQMPWFFSEDLSLREAFFRLSFLDFLLDRKTSFATEFAFQQKPWKKDIRLFKKEVSLSFAISRGAKTSHAAFKPAEKFTIQITLQEPWLLGDRIQLFLPKEIGVLQDPASGCWEMPSDGVLQVFCFAKEETLDVYQEPTSKTWGFRMFNLHQEERGFCSLEQNLQVLLPHKQNSKRNWLHPWNWVTKK